jgi:hypothetical protein
MGGRLLSWYLSFGEYDGLLIYEAPDNATAGTAALAAASRGHLRALKTTPLFTAEESVELMRRAGGTSFRAPGQWYCSGFGKGRPFPKPPLDLQR